MQANRLVDLSSDTSTRPSVAMRKAMAEAEVGDEQKAEDPTTNALQARVADLLGKEAAVFLPSGTMCNHIALLVHGRPGDEVIAADVAHIFTSEAGGGSALAPACARANPAFRASPSSLCKGSPPVRTWDAASSASDTLPEERSDRADRARSVGVMRFL